MINKFEVSAFRVRCFPLICIIPIFGLLQLVSGAEDFCFGNDTKCGESTWGGKCNQPNGSQSPIDIPLPPKSLPIPLTKLKFSALYKTDFKGFDILNDGHTVQIKLNLNETGELAVTGFGKMRYIFDKIDFHWGINGVKGSAHSINKQKSDMEAHFIHYNSNYNSLKDALASGNQSAVATIGALSSKDTSGAKEVYEPIRAGLQALKGLPCDGKPIRVNSTINFYNLLGVEPPDVLYTYAGSRTFPPCTEGVQWIVFEVERGIQASDLEAFSNVECSGKKIGNNFRSIKPLNNRKISYVKYTVN